MMYIFLTVLFFLLMLGYFRVADRYNIIDKPNSRSSHTRITIRGGGIIILFAAIMLAAWHFSETWLAVMGILMIGVISFLDDILTLSNKIRLIVHVLAVSCMLQYLSVFSIFSILPVIGFYILVIGIINAYNFMDGINGITGLYSLVTLATLQYLNYAVGEFVVPDMIWLPMLACGVFLFFNFRLKAKCFAGDVGSVSIAFWVMLLILAVILKTNEPKYILLLSVYGVDAILTIIHRLILKQNIFEAHRLHLYQLLVNERGIPHLVVASIYGVLQSLINVFVVMSNLSFGVSFLAVCLPLVIVYVTLKPRLLKWTT